MFKLTRPEIEKYLENEEIVLFPIGSTEQHGLHLPVGNDSYHASEISKKVAEKTGTLVSPTLPYGNSYHHMNFSGTITLSYGTFVNVIKEVCRSLHNHGFKKIVIMNGHGGNRYAITQAIREIREEMSIIVYFINVWPGAGFGSETTTILEQEDGGHSCEMETSLALYLGQRVQMDKAKKWKPPKSWTEFDTKYKGKVIMAKNFDERTEIGSLGDPTIATSEKGKYMVETVIREISEFVEDLKKERT